MLLALPNHNLVQMNMYIEWVGFLIMSEDLVDLNLQVRSKVNISAIIQVYGFSLKSIYSFQETPQMEQM